METNTPSIPSPPGGLIARRGLVKSALVRFVDEALRINAVQHSFSASSREKTCNWPLLSIDTPGLIKVFGGASSEVPIPVGGTAVLLCGVSCAGQEAAQGVPGSFRLEMDENRCCRNLKPEGG